MTAEFAGKVAMIAGAGGGIGLNTANDLLQEGANVSLVDIKPQPDNIVDGPGKRHYCRGDVTDENFVRDAVASTLNTFGRLDYLVNTTGVLWFDEDRSLMDMDFDVWDKVMAINLKSFALSARYAIDAMKQSGGGAMVHFSSIDALCGDLRPQDAYGASKAAVMRLSKSIAIQCAADNIRSNCILPGPLMSPMQERWEGKPDLQAQVASSIPLGRIGTTQDMSNACLFLLSDRANFITGAELIVDGGIRAR